MTDESRRGGSQPSGGAPGGPKLYHAGTLTYTKPALAILFFWLLWGDFCYTLMESVTGPLMQLKFQALGASNTELGLIAGTIPSLVYSCLNPIISFKSDRFRSRWGRRIPFIIFTLPCLVSGLVALAYGEHISTFLRSFLGAASISPATFTIWTLAVLLVIFTFFNTFVTSVFWYLFNDVVPEHLLARFMSWFRVVGLASASVYNLYVLPQSQTHYTEIFLGAAALYAVGFTLMCFNVREGEYPPPPAYVDGQTGPVAAIKTYAAECHAFPHYWYLWISTFIGSIGGGVGVFGLLFQKSTGVDLAHIGKINFALTLTTGLLVLVSGWLADKYHPIRVAMSGAFLGLFVATPATMIWLFWLPSPHIAFLIQLTITIALSAPVAALTGVWDPPLLMRLFPRSRYGQFCSVNAVWRMVGSIIGGVSAGYFLDKIGGWTKDTAHAYFYIPIWQMCFGVPSFIILIFLYRSWLKHGGDDKYIAPILASASTTMPGQAQAALASTERDKDPL